MANIISISEYHTYDDAPSPSENDAQIAVLIEAATAYIEAITGRTFLLVASSPVDTTEILNGNNTHRLYSHNAPIISITSIEYWDGTQWLEYDSTTYPYTFKANSNIVYFTNGHKFYKGYRNIKLTFEHGYISAFPNNLKYACFRIAQYFILEADRQGLKIQSDGEQSFHYAHNFPKEALSIIWRYKTNI